MAAKKTSAKPVAKPVAKKAPAKKAAPANKKATPAAEKKSGPAVKKPAPVSKTNPIVTKYTKTQMLNEISEATSLTKKQVGSVLDQITSLIDRHIKKRGVGEFTLPGLLKIKTVKKPARKARKGINPFTKQETVFKARPASTAVKVLPLKALKDMVN